MVIPYGRFERIYQFHLQDQEVQQEFFLDFMTLDDRTDRLSRNVGMKLPFCTV